MSEKKLLPDLDITIIATLTKPKLLDMNNRKSKPNAKHFLGVRQ